jgi:eukaryotic-like serine/threonine-protein kinase
VAPVETQAEFNEGPKLPNVGDTLGQYQLLAQVGSGGMGRVWAARQLGALQRLVAIKTALTEGAQTAEFERVFLDEARIASLIHHPHVCGVYELGEEQGVLYLVMEWSDGGTLLEVLKRQPGAILEPMVAAAIVAKVCAGLHAAHELEDETGSPLNVVHRDVTPQNILLSSQGHVRLADFGVAKAQGQIHRPTETGEVKGKLNYMAPEQLTSKLVDRRVDIFALGCVLYECTAGRRPFQGDGALSTLYQILEHEVESPANLIPDYPAELARIVLKALSKQASARYQTAEEMQKELEAWLITESAIVGEAQLARLVMDALGDSIRARNELIDLAIERFDSGDFSSDNSSAEAERARAVIGESSAPGVSTPPRPTESRGPMWPWALGLVAAAGAALFIVTRAPTEVPHEPAPAVVVTSVKPSEKVKIRLTTNPEHATVTIDGETRETPFTIEVDKDARVREVMIAKKNYLTRVERLQFDKSQDVSYQLQQEVAAAEIPAATASVAEPKVPTEKKGTKPVRKPDEPATVSSPQPAPAQQPTPATKPPTRILDTQNPF